MTQCLHSNSINTLLLTGNFQKVKIQNPYQMIFKDIFWSCLEIFRPVSDNFWEAAEHLTFEEQCERLLGGLASRHAAVHICA